MLQYGATQIWNGSSDIYLGNTGLNSKSTLKISVSDLSDKNKVDFHLGETPTFDSR